MQSAHSFYRSTSLAVAFILLTTMLAGAIPASTLYAKTVNYLKDIQPIFNQRCVACHSCYDSPCTLKLSSFEGLSRGASSYDLYGNRIASIPHLRLGQDAKSVVQWREFGFWSVVPETNLSAKRVRADQTLLYHLVNLGATNNLPGKINNLEQRAPDTCLKSVDDWKQSDPSVAAHLGMPFGLPPLTDKQLATLKEWVEGGAKGPNFSEQLASNYSHSPRSIAKWEEFFNGGELKQQWSAKYLFEHLYLAHFHFPREIGKGEEEFYRLVRSKTPAPYPIDEIVTKLPFDPPQERFFYRFQKITSTIVHKTHIVYHATPKRLHRLKELFWHKPWQQNRLVPLNWDSNNPFVNFRPIPPKIRYRWMLENAKILVDFFTRGPVCNGSVATYAVRDYFWTFFAHPDSPFSMTDSRVLDRLAPMLDLPTLSDDQQLFHLSQNQVERYEELHASLLTGINGGKGVMIKDLWQGSDESVLTIYRHQLSVSVHTGAQGVQMPHTYWVLDYPIFERIYYSLVATFNVFGSMDHKVATRIYMENLRREGEDNFLLFLPSKIRAGGRELWYQQTNLFGIEQLDERPFYLRSVPSFVKIARPVGKAAIMELASKMLKHTGVQTKSYVDVMPSELQKINQVKGPFNQFFRDVSFLRINRNGKYHYYTMIAHRHHKTMNVLFLEERTRDPSGDTISIIPDTLLSYPNIFFDMPFSQLDKFVKRVQGITNWLEYERLEEEFAVKKSDFTFWSFYDHAAEYYLQHLPLEYGVVDLNRYQLPRGVGTKVAQLWLKGRESSLNFYKEKSQQAKNFLEKRKDKAKEYLDVQHSSIEKFWKQKVKQVNQLKQEVSKIQWP